ncbi:hypothetical protein KIL84_005658 [Mauremys mutica]|uniref:Uncharacterized protein n=1 Tax=Mauremys mutica TaxID=74926 RepID=A0A9D4B2Z4_9SAUR|nr:hypothetical protein KIL84_005658 [Mauremys mutica]
MQPANDEYPAFPHEQRLVQHCLQVRGKSTFSGPRSRGNVRMCTSIKRLLMRMKSRTCFKPLQDQALSFLIGEDGKVYEGRGWNTEGAHTYGYNDISLGIAFIGDFTGRSPNAAAWIALKHLLHFAVENGYLSSDYLLMAHGDVSNTISPGQPIRKVLKTWPHYKH